MYIKIEKYEEIKRIVYGKLVDKTIDTDYQDLSELLFGEGNCFSATEVRKRMYGMKTVIDAVEESGAVGSIESGSISELDQRKLELQKERQKFFDQRNAFNKLVREQARREQIQEIIEKAVMDGRLPLLKSNSVYQKPGDNDLLISLNDIHYGANVNNYWNQYNSDICQKMLERYLDNIMGIAA